MLKLSPDKLPAKQGIMTFEIIVNFDLWAKESFFYCFLQILIFL